MVSVAFQVARAYSELVSRLVAGPVGSETVEHTTGSPVAGSICWLPTWLMP